MKSKLNPYLNFKNETKSVMEFYESVLGGKLTLQTFKDFHASTDPSEDNLIMHSMLDVSDYISIMAADVPARMEYKPGNNFSLSLSGDNEEELTKFFNALSKGGKVTMPLGTAAWGATFGMFIDKFGVSWLVNIFKEDPES